MKPLAFVAGAVAGVGAVLLSVRWSIRSGLVFRYLTAQARTIAQRAEAERAAYAETVVP